MREAAASYLPGVLFEGPVLSGALGQPGTAGDVGVHDPLYRSRSGYLYVVQHDVRAVLEDLQAAGVELVVFIDDLDRCTPATTAQVLEAINLFMSREFPGARFILGLDPEVVAAHIDHTYAELLGTPSSSGAPAPAIAAPGDPTPGWTFLRKLVQLPVMLPAVTDDGLDQLVDDILSPAEQPTSRPAVHQPADTPVADPSTGPPPATGDQPEPSDDRRPSAEPAEDLTTAAERDDSGAASARAEPRPAASPAAATERTDALLATLEGEPAVRSRIQERVRLLPDRSARDVKRLLTIWQFYVRVLDRTDPVRAEAALIQRARLLVFVAEIITRWPAHQTALRRLHPSPTGEPTRGLQLLAVAAPDDDTWTATTHLVLPDPPSGLRELLRDHDGAAVAALYARIT